MYIYLPREKKKKKKIVPKQESSIDTCIYFLNRRDENYDLRAALHRRIGLRKYSLKGVFGTGMSFPITARGQLQERQ